MTKNVLIIGAGRRVIETIIPALICLQNEFRIAAVYSRTEKRLILDNGRYAYETTTDLSKVDFNTLAIIIVAVTTDAVPSIMRSLKRHKTSHLILMLDTPVLCFKHLYASIYFSKFKKVLVSEDILALPSFLLARRLVDDGRIGKLQSIHMFHNGYKYHAVASMKLLAQCSAIERVDTVFHSGNLISKCFKFANGVVGVLYEPRNYESGKLLLRGRSGVIADYDFVCAQSVWRIKYRTVAGRYAGVFTDGVEFSRELDLPFEQLLPAGIPRCSQMKLMKIRGLMDLIFEAAQVKSKYHYHPYDAITDNVIATLSDSMRYLTPSKLGLCGQLR